MKNKIIFLLLGMFLLSLVSADTEYIKANKLINLTFDCTINGAIPSSSAVLNLTLFTNDGVLVLNNAPTSPIGNGVFYYQYTFSDNLTTNYKSIIFCSDGALNSSGTNFYEINSNGKAPPSGIVIVLFVLIFLLIMAFLIYELIVSIGHLFSLDLDVVDLAKSIGLYFSLISLYYLANFYMGNSHIESTLLTLIIVGAFTHVIMPLIGFIISITVGSLSKKKVDFGTSRIMRRVKVVKV